MLAITMGDPAGVGPEVLAKVLVDRATQRAAGIARPEARWLLVGARWALEAGARAARVTLPEIGTCTADAAPDAGVFGDLGIALLDLAVAEPPAFRFGEVCGECGALAVAAVERAAGLCLDGVANAMVTCPINKEAINAAGCTDIGHQEILARLSGVSSTMTMLMTPGLRVAHLSTHKSLIEAARYVTRDVLVQKLELLHGSLEGAGLASPRIAVAALNPHGGEGGLIGREEVDEIAPAVADARARGWAVTGPVPADSVFNRAIGGEFDVVLAMYHDQGHIAIKVHNFHDSVTATLGIPFVRTSVDHGTAFDIAGRGVADSRGLQAAIRAAEALVGGTLARF